MPGINSILDIGRWALFGNQAAIHVTGNNISNVNTEGYSRQEVRFEEQQTIDYRPGQIGMGVEAAEVIRHFDEFVEEQFLDKFGMQSRYESLWETLKGVDSLMDESNTDGLSAALGQFYQAWQDLSLRPDDYSTREALLGHSQNLTSLMQNMDADMAQLQSQMDDFVSQNISEINGIMDEIAGINLQISSHHIEGVNNANTLFDERARLVRDLAQYIDVDVIDNGGSDFQVMTKSGHTLVDGTETFTLAFETARATANLKSTSQFDGSIAFEGAEDYELTIDVINSGSVSSGAGAATFRVSLDGGRSWVKDADGQIAEFYARPEDYKVSIGGVNVWFENATQDLSVGDRFNITAKSGVYWYENSSTSVNLTPQILQDGTDNTARITGGELGGYLNFRDHYLGRYRDKLDAFAESLIWEVNRLHSQGTGLTKLGEVVGTYSVNDTSLALGSNSSGLSMNDKLSEGNLMVFVYDTSTGALASNASYGSLDFSGVNPPGSVNFDPDSHSLDDVVTAFNDSFGSFLTAKVNNNRLHLEADSGYQFAFGSDTSGLLAGLGINTFFTGDDADSIAMNSDVRVDFDRIAAGHVNGAGEANPGDNKTALAIADLQYTDVSIRTDFESASTTTIGEYYNTLVSSVGADTANAEFSYKYQRSLADDLNQRQQQLAGVNLDEEMTNLIKYQHSYRAAAKLITTADQMLQTLLTLKQ
jgi:flagellar hook-associated protein 1 FlgK